MKKKILFVDDEDMVLQGLRRMLRSMRLEWDMEFVESGAAALERMEQTSFDVIISDMRMPGMNGADLLNEVMKRSPKTIRFILSGHADMDLIFTCAGAAHQFLAKPCDADILKATVMRATRLESLLQSDKLGELVSRIDRLPSAPSLYLELVEVMKHSDSGVEEIEAVISKDMAMTATILKLVNSAFFGLHREVSSTGDATRFLGVETIRALVLATHTFSQLEPTDIKGFSADALFHHSFTTANAAKTIAQLEGADRKLSDEAYVAGLLHDIGKLVLAVNFNDEFAQSIQLTGDHGIDDWEAEQRVFGATHADVGGCLLGLWGLPVPVIEAICMHHNPRRAGQKTFTALTAVHAATAILQSTEIAGSSPERFFDMQYLAELGLTEHANAWREGLLEAASKQNTP